MTYGFIFSAGKEARFASDKPKALSNIGGKCLLDTNISVLNKFCDKVFVVVSPSNKHFFDKYETIVIDSGKGCGDAVMKAMQSLDFEENDMCFISWGDCIVQEDVIEHTLMGYKKGVDIVVPCAFEENPYVSLVQSHGYISAKFKKYGEVCKYGYHDFGTFYGVCSIILEYLETFSEKIKDGDRYKHKHGDEMQFLDIFNETEIDGLLLQIENVRPLSFNSTKELHEIQN